MGTAARVFLLLVLTSSWGSAAADRVYYQLRVEGMVCAYCAYNLSRHLGDLPGVSQEGVKVDLAGETVQFASDRSLAREAVASAVETAGFSMIHMEKDSESSAPPATDRGERVLRLELDRVALGGGYGDGLLEALGSAVVRKGGRLEVNAPGKLEAGVLKPLLMGRKTAVPVHFEPGGVPDGGIAVEWYRSTIKY